MAGIKQPILDIMDRLRTVTVTNGDSSTATPYVRIWNNQVAYLKEGKMEAFPLPAMFVEVINSPAYEVIGEGFRGADLGFKIHICHEFYDGQDGTMEQDLLVFDLRDKVIGYLTGFKPTGCSVLFSISEGQDYEHDNVYHMTVDFTCNFTDSKGSKYDPEHPEAYIQKEPPTDLQLNVNTRTQTITQLFNVAQGQAYSTSYKATHDGETQLLILDANGNMIVGSNIVQMQKSILPLTPLQWSWNKSTSVLTLIGVSLLAEESAFIIYQQNA